MEDKKKSTKFYTKGTQNEVLIGTDTGRPQIRCGICESCGSAKYVDKKTGSEVTGKETISGAGVKTWTYPAGYKLEPINATQCEHYKDVDIMCSFCGEHFTGSKNALGQFTEIIGSRVVKVLSFSDKPNELVMCCDDWTCRRKFFDQHGFDL